MSGLGALLLVLLAPAWAWAATTYVASPNGSGVVCTEANPCAPIQAAVRLRPGDTLLLKNGVYPVELDFSAIQVDFGTAARPITVRAETLGRAVIVLRGRHPSAYWKFEGVPILSMQPRAGVNRYAVVSGGMTTGTCTPQANACTMKQLLVALQAGDTGWVGDGTYMGPDGLLDLWYVNAGKSGSPGLPITVRAINEGAVWFDSNFGSGTTGGDSVGIQIYGSSYWTFIGMNAVRGGLFIGLATNTNLTFQRMCFGNGTYSIPNSSNAHAVSLNNVHDSLFEDICAFGTGRTTITDSDTGNNVFRNWWVRFEGAPIDINGCPGTPVWQFSYNHGANTLTNLYENIVTIYDPEQYNLATWGTFACSIGVSYNGGSYRRDLGGLNRWFNRITFGYNGFHAPGQTEIQDSWFLSRYPFLQLQDFTVDGRSGKTTGVAPLDLSCDLGDTAQCPATISSDRMTTYRVSTAPTSASKMSGGWAGKITNWQECTAVDTITGSTIGGCPHFYLGTTSGGSPLGARHCHEYRDGVLQDGTGGTIETRMWPWRMDSRIRAALAHENAAGRGGSALRGGGGTGYEAATVTSEMATLYGTPPASCLRAGPFTPPFPAAGDFPSTGVLDDFNRSNSSTLGANYTVSVGPGFGVDTNQALANATFSRQAWSASSFAGLGHEVHVVYPVGKPVGTAATLLSFAGLNPASANSQYRLYLNRTGATSTLYIDKIDSGGGFSSVLAPVDLGIDAGDGNGFGVRVNTAGTISVYWKYTDGNWYLVGQVFDGSLPTGPVYGGFAGTSPERIENLGGGTCCGAGSVTPGPAGRLGTGFPKVP